MQNPETSIEQSFPGRSAAAMCVAVPSAVIPYDHRNFSVRSFSRQYRTQARCRHGRPTRMQDLASLSRTVMTWRRPRGFSVPASTHQRDALLSRCVLAHALCIRHRWLAWPSSAQADVQGTDRQKKYRAPIPASRPNPVDDVSWNDGTSSRNTSMGVLCGSHAIPNTPRTATDPSYPAPLFMRPPKP